MLARWLIVLIALAAQGTTLLSPFYLVRCDGGDGLVSFDVRGRACDCCECATLHGANEGELLGGHEEHGHHQHDDVRGQGISCEHCSCRHFPVESAPQVRVTPVALSHLLEAQQFAFQYAVLNLGSVIEIHENTNLRPSLFRPHESSPHLIVVSTVVLRV